MRRPVEQPVLQRPGDAGDRQRIPEHARAGRGRASSSSSSEVTARAVRRSSSDRPEPSTICTPASGTPAAARAADHDGVAGGGRARAADLGAEILQQQLGDVVVAVVIHLGEDVRQRLRVRPARAAWRPAGAVPSEIAAGRDPRRAERLPELRGRRDRRRERKAVADQVAVRDERRQRRALLEEERRLPARRGADGVEPRLVGDQMPGHPPDARARRAGSRAASGRPTTRVGSPKPFSTRLPCHTVPSCQPSPSTSVRNS